MGIEVVDHYCLEKPTRPFAHHWIGTISLDKGTVFICKYCLKAMWWPNSLNDCVDLSQMVKREGLEEGYMHFLASRPKVIDLLKRLQGVRAVSMVVKDEYLLHQIIGTIMTAKDYPDD